ncbi:MAG: NFACT family protein [Clostridia bacterium]|nr:NFACT family protein [Clostridia bacterium]
MPFDAGMFRASVHEINTLASDARVEKVYQPEKEEIVLLLRTQRENYRLSVRAGSNSPRFALTAVSKENPEKAPMFCMLLRKHLSGARFLNVIQQGFERAAEFIFDSHDEMGYQCKKYLVIEIMGTYSNIILLDGERKILGALKTVDLTDNSGRAILTGLFYENPPAQKKADPCTATEEEFYRFLSSADSDMPADKFIMSKYMGISSLIAREIAYRATGHSDGAVSTVTPEVLYSEFSRIISDINSDLFTPVMIISKEGKPIDYTFTDIKQYGTSATVREYGNFYSMTDEFFGRREHIEHMKQRSSDILRLLTNADTRLRKKIALQLEELDATDDMEKYKKFGDLITSSIYALKRGMKEVTLTDYYSEDCGEVKITLDEKLSPSQNAQRYYKKYAKMKVAKVELSKQIESAEKELEYIDTVFDALTRASSENDLLEIRAELYSSGFASKMKNHIQRKKIQNAPLEYITTEGYKVLCGKNNVQNDILTTKTAAKGDYWFHVKNEAGSHVILLCDGDEPSELTFTEAAEIAAYNSKSRGGQNIAVDYTRVKNVKKPGGAKPGFVIYNTNYTAYVTPDESRIEKMHKTK